MTFDEIKQALNDEIREAREREAHYIDNEVTSSAAWYGGRANGLMYALELIQKLSRPADLRAVD